MLGSILYSYETTNGEIRPLPASPLLLPALVWISVAALFRSIGPSRYKRIPITFNQAEYETNKQLYHQILPKVLAGEELSVYEHNLWYNVLPYPSWRKQGERWQY
jgi:hypothetical protein